MGIGNCGLFCCGLYGCRVSGCQGLTSSDFEGGGLQAFVIWFEAWGLLGSVEVEGFVLRVFRLDFFAGLLVSSRIPTLGSNPSTV